MNGNNNEPRERRQRILRLDTNTILTFLRQRAPSADDGLSLTYVELPEGTRVVAVYYNHIRACFEFAIEHDSFEVVPEGEAAPPHPLRQRHVRVFAPDKLPHITFSQLGTSFLPDLENVLEAGAISPHAPSSMTCRQSPKVFIPRLPCSAFVASNADNLP
jgi:hypothetical protein